MHTGFYQMVHFLNRFMLLKVAKCHFVVILGFLILLMKCSEFFMHELNSLLEGRRFSRGVASNVPQTVDCSMCIWLCSLVFWQLVVIILTGLLFLF
jgi:hypothetical protein